MSAHTISRRIVAAVLALAALAAVALGSTNSAHAATPTCAGRLTGASQTTIYAMEESLLCLTNTERQAEGLTPLRLNTRLRLAARAHSWDMITRDYDAHTSPDGKGADWRMTKAGYSFSAWGENIGWGFTSSQAMFDWWMDSKGHHDNMLSGTDVSKRFTEIGLGVARRGGTTKFTMVLAQPSGATGNGYTGLEPMFQGNPYQRYRYLGRGAIKVVTLPLK
jgi:uncharacterized protein YkwD